MSTQPEKTVDMVNIEIDGQAMEVPKNSMIIEATDKAGISIPRFCYHSKLSIAANCRMCLVDVEKAPKPMPACATPVMDGMKIYTHSRRAIDAQHGVMEFLLINHPLDCPIVIRAASVNCRIWRWGTAALFPDSPSVNAWFRIIISARWCKLT